MIRKYPLTLLIASLLIGVTQVKGQISGRILGQGRSITTAVPFLTISPDARSGAMGDAGVSISPDANAIYWNPAKLAFIEKRAGASVSYTPWLRNLVNDMSISNLSGYYKVDENQAVGVALTYFNLGDIQFTDIVGVPIIDFNPREFSFAGTYSRKLSENFGLAVGLKYIHSNLAGNFDFAGVGQVRAGNTAAGDIAIYYNKDLNVSGNDVNLALGASLTNLGAKISYSDRNNREFIPTTLKFGPAITYNADPYNKFTFTVDFNKLLVPSPPIYATNPDGSFQRDDNNNLIIEEGKDPNRTFLSGAIGSFGDAPGGFSEEIREFFIATGVEYWYNDLFAARAGYFSENRDKGNRKYFTVGVGIRYQTLGFDFAYLIPQAQQNPLAETLRFTLRFNFGEVAEESTAQ